MSCLSLGFLYQLCVWLIVVAAVYAILKLLLPYLNNLVPSIVVQIINIVIWAVIAIMVVYIIFLLLSCLLGGAPGFGVGFPRR